MKSIEIWCNVKRVSFFQQKNSFWIVDKNVINQNL